MERPVRISVITPVLNQVRYLEESIFSVLEQKPNFNIEFLVMDGGSTDGTLELLSRYSTHLTVISGRDQGQSDALNKGFELACGEIIGWLNADDLYHPGTLEKVVAWFDVHPECQWVIGQCDIVDEAGHETRKWLTRYKNALLQRYSLELLLVENFISQPAVFFRKEFLAGIGPLRLEYPLAMDYDLWIRMALRSRPGLIRSPLASFRVHPEAKSAQNFREQFREQFRIHLKHDQRWALLALHRISVLKNILGYSLMKILRFFF